MDQMRVALVFGLAVLAASPALATDWRLVDNSNTTLWYDDDSVEWDDEGDFVFFDVYHGAWAGAQSMSANSIGLAYDCWDGDGYVWNVSTEDWDSSGAYTNHELLSELAFFYCY